MRKSIIIGLTCCMCMVLAVTGLWAAELEKDKKRAESVAEDENQLHVGLCVINVEEKTIRVVPWNSETSKWEKDSAQVIQWKNSTQIQGATNRITMAEFVSGKNLDDDIKVLKDLHGKRGALIIDESKGEVMIKEITIMTMFAGENLPGYVVLGEKPRFILIGNNTVPCCDEMAKE